MFLDNKICLNYELCSNIIHMNFIRAGFLFTNWILLLKTFINRTLSFVYVCLFLRYYTRLLSSFFLPLQFWGPSWSWSHGSWIYNYMFLYLCCEFESRSGRGVQHYVIKFVSDLRQVGGFLQVTPVSSTNKTDRHDITEILLKEALSNIKQTNKQTLQF